MQGPTPTHTPDASTTMQAEPGQPPAARHPVLSRLLHDLNQPLSAMTNYAQAGSQLLANGGADPERLKSLFDKIVQQGARAAALSQELRKAQDAAAADHSS